MPPPIYLSTAFSHKKEHTNTVFLGMSHTKTCKKVEIVVALKLQCCYTNLCVKKKNYIRGRIKRC